MFKKADSDVIKHDQIFEEGIFDDHVIEEAKRGIIAFKDLENIVVGAAKNMNKSLKGVSFVDVAGLKALNAQLAKVNELAKQNAIIQKAKTQLDAEGIKTTKAETDAEIALEKKKQETLKTEKAQLDINAKKERQQEKNIKLTADQAAKQQIENQRKKDEIALAKAALVELDKTAGTLQRLEAANARLRIERKNLNTETKEGAERLKQINTELDKNNAKIVEQSDTLKKQKLNVGNYKESIKEAAQELGLFDGEIGKAVYFAKIWGNEVKANIVAIKEQVTAQDAATGATSKWNKALNVTKLTIKALGIGAIIALLGSIAASFKTTETGIVQFEATMNSIGDIIKIFIGRLGLFGSALLKYIPAVFKDISNGIKNTVNEVKEFFGAAKQIPLSTNNAAAALNQMKTAFDGISDAIAQTIKLEKELAQLRRDNRRANLKDQELIRKYASEVERLNQISDDQTLSFQEREKAADDALEALKKSSNAEVRIRQRAVVEAQKELDVRKLQNQDTLDAQEHLAQALDQLDDAQTKRDVLRLQGEQRQRIVRIKQLQNQVDLLEKTFDKEKEITDQEIQDRENAFAKRQELIDKESKASQEKYNKEVAAVSKAAKVAIDANQLMTISSEEELAARIKSFKLGDKAEDILLRALINRKAEVKATIEQIRQLTKDIDADLRAQKDVENEIRKENMRAIQIAIDKEMAAAEDNLSRQKDLLKQRQMLRERELRDQAAFDKKKVQDDPVKSAELKAKEILLIEKKLQNDLKELNEKGTIEQEAIWKKQKDQIVKVVNEITDGVADGLAKRSELQQQADQRDIDFHTRMLEVQAKLAAEGKDNILAQELAAADRAEEKKLQDAKRAQKIQEDIALVKVFTDTLSTALDKKEPFLKAFAEAIGATGVVKTVFSQIFSGSALEGTEDTGTPSDSKGIDGKGGMAYIVHPKERILTKEQNEALGGISNDDLVANALAFENMYVPQFNAANISSTSVKPDPQIPVMTTTLARKIDALIDAVENKPVPSTNLGRLNEWTDEIQRRGMKAIIHHKKARSSMRKHG